MWHCLRSYIKNSCFGSHQGLQTPRNNKSTRPKRPRAFICFSVFGTPDETLALVVDILLKRQCILILDMQLICVFVFLPVLTVINFLNRFHQVRSYDRNIAVNVWWTHKPDFIPKDCDMEPNQTLDKFNFSSLQAESSSQQQPDLM